MNNQQRGTNPSATVIDDSDHTDDTPLPIRWVDLQGSAPARSSSPPSGSGLTKTALLDQLYQDFCQRHEAGEVLDRDEYCARFPSFRSSLGRLLQLHQYLEEHLPEVPEVRWPEAGETFLDFQLLLELGKGAFARVFLATEAKLGNRLVAVKIAFKGAAEAEVLGRINHPNIVPVHSVQEDPGTGLTAVCMPYVGSATLCDVKDLAFSAPGSQAGAILAAVQELPYPRDPVAHLLPAEPVLQTGTYLDGIRLIGARLADALAFLQERGICHRDLKPSNVLMSPEGVPMLLDFNLCADPRQTRHLLGGTLAYMSPEQLRATGLDAPPEDAAKTLDGRSDLYSLGVILYELVTGAHPFGPLPLKLPTEELHRYLLERQPQGPIEARLVNPDLDESFSQLIQRCLALDPKDRPQTANEVASALHAPARSASDGVSPRARWIRRHAGKVVAAAVLLAAITLSGFAFAPLRQPEAKPPIEIGLQFFDQGEYRKALPYLNDALQADPNNNAALRTRAIVHQQLGEFDLAMQDYAKADQQIPDGRNQAGLGYCRNRKDSPTEVALLHHDKAIESGFATAEVYNNRGFNLLRAKNRLKEAKADLDRAIGLDPKLQAAYHNRALVVYSQVLLKKGQLKPTAKDAEIYLTLKSAIADAKKAIDLGAGSAELYFDAARLCALALKVEPLWEEPALQYLTDAVANGHPRALSDSVFDRLRNHASFKKLAQGDHPQQPPPPTRRLVDPVKDHAR